MTVKITSKGKVSIAIPASLKPFVKHLLEKFMDNLSDSIGSTKTVHLNNIEDRILRALVDEVYVKHHTQLSIISQDCKLVLTWAQANALWQLCQLWDQEAFNNPGMGGLLLNLHQKLS